MDAAGGDTARLWLYWELCVLLSRTLRGGRLTNLTVTPNHRRRKRTAGCLCGEAAAQQPRSCCCVCSTCFHIICGILASRRFMGGGKRLACQQGQQRTGPQASKKPALAQDRYFMGDCNNRAAVQAAQRARSNASRALKDTQGSSDGSALVQAWHSRSALQRHTPKRQTRRIIRKVWSAPRPTPAGLAAPPRTTLQAHRALPAQRKRRAPLAAALPSRARRVASPAIAHRQRM